MGADPGVKRDPPPAEAVGVDQGMHVAGDQQDELNECRQEQGAMEKSQYLVVEADESDRLFPEAVTHSRRRH